MLLSFEFPNRYSRQTYIHIICTNTVCNCADVPLCLLLSVWICCYYYHYRYYYSGDDIACVIIVVDVEENGNVRFFPWLNALYYLHTLMHLNYIISKREKGFFYFLNEIAEHVPTSFPFHVKLFFTYLLLTSITHITNMGNGKWV